MTDAEPPASPPTAATISPEPPASRRALRAEVLAVLAVAVIPRLVQPVAQITAAGPYPPIPYWADTVDLTVLSACEIFVVLYLLRRSGEPLDRFGVDRPLWVDVPLGFVLIICTYFVAKLAAAFGPLSDIATPYPFPRPSGLPGLAMGLIKFGVAAYSEELVFRGYLITRLGTLLGSNGRAVLTAAVLFGLAHGYQGPTGIVFTFLFGLAYGTVYLGMGRIWPLAIGHALSNLIIDHTR